jgi:chromosome segregation ATPase
MDSFTNRLEEKVSTMLKGQETEFVNSYKNHMSTVEQALKDYEQRIVQFQKKIEYYENEGVLSTLLNKINFLETHERKLLESIDKKNRTIFDLRN